MCVAVGMAKNWKIFVDLIYDSCHILFTVGNCSNKCNI